MQESLPLNAGSPLEPAKGRPFLAISSTRQPTRQISQTTAAITAYPTTSLVETGSQRSTAFIANAALVPPTVTTAA